MSQPSKTCLAGNDIFAVAHFHSKSESDEIIMLSESNGFEGATVHTASGHQSRSDWRNNTRVIIDDADRASWLWERAPDASWKTSYAECLNVDVRIQPPF